MTLIEIMLVMSIVAMLGGLLAVKAKDLLHAYSFRQEVTFLRRHLELARNYALSYEADVEVIITQGEGPIRCLFKSDEPYLEHQIFSKPYTFKKIQHLYVEESETPLSHILFSGTGWMFPIVNLELVSEREEKALIRLGDTLK